MPNRLPWYRALAQVILLGVVVGSCQKRLEPGPTSTVALLDTLQLINDGDIASTAIRLTSLLRSTGHQTNLIVGHVCSTTHQRPTLEQNDAFSRGEVRVGALPYRFTTLVSGLQPATHYYTRAYVTNSIATTYGPTAEFTTLTKQKTVYATLAKLLDDSLRPKDVGYAFAIYQGSTRMAGGAGGLASRSIDPGGAVGYTLDTKMHVASISKTITAFAFLAIAARQGLNLTTRIAPYLPPNWPQGPNVDRITFSDLLTHQSGLSSLGTNCQAGPLAENEYGFLRQTIANGVTRYGQYCYQNVNYALLRVLIPAVMRYAYVGDDEVDNTHTSTRYGQVVDSVVFRPLGLANIGVSEPVHEPIYLYSYPYQGSRGYSTGDFTGRAGAVGWYLTAAEAGKLFATVLSSDDESVLSTASKTRLLTDRLGCLAGLLGEQTVVYYHDGWQWEPDPSRAGSYRGLRTVWMKYPDEVTIVLFVNAINQHRLFPSNTGLDIVEYVDQSYRRAHQIQDGRQGHVSLQVEHPGAH